MWITQQLHCPLLTSRGPKVTLHTRGQLVPPQPGIGAHTRQIFPAWPPVPLSRDPRSPQGRTFRSPCLPTAHSQLSLPGPPKPARSLPDTPPATQSGPPCPAVEAVPVTANCPRGCTLCLRQPRRPPSPPFRLGLGSSLRPASRPTRPHPPDTHTTPPPPDIHPHPAAGSFLIVFSTDAALLSAFRASFFSQSNSLPLNPHWRTRRSVSDPLQEATTLIPGPAFSNQTETPSWITEVPQGHDSSHPAPQSVWSACCFLLPLIPVCFILHYTIVSSNIILKSKTHCICFLD